jgi:hypothetical protein
MNGAPPLQLDFASTRRHVSAVGIALLATGISVLAVTVVEYHSVRSQRAGLELKLAAAVLRLRPRDLTASRRAPVEEASGVVRELGTPWTTLLAELEKASGEMQEKIALLSIEPDQEKHRVRITGESRDLPLTLAYVQKLQASNLLRYPMLDSHEVQTGDNERPVRFAVTAEWVESP